MADVILVIMMTSIFVVALATYEYIKKHSEEFTDED